MDEDPPQEFANHLDDDDNERYPGEPDAQSRTGRLECALVALLAVVLRLFCFC